MRIIEQIRWGKLKNLVFDDELNQTCGEIRMNHTDYGEEDEYCFFPDKIAFDSKQLKEITKILENKNKEEGK